MNRTLIIIPAFNEAETIDTVIESLHITNLEWDLLVVNDCSEDSTGDKAKRSGYATVIDLPCNLGIGGCVQTGFKFAERHGYEHAVQFDGDGQHKTDEIHKILEPILSGKADVTIGSRFLKKHPGYRPSIFRRVGIHIFQIVNSILIQQSITDNTSGFRAYNKDAIRFLSRYYPMDYPEPEAIIFLSKNGFKLKEVSVEMYARDKGRSSIRGCRTVYYMVKVLLAIIITSIRPGIGHDQYH